MLWHADKEKSIRIPMHWAGPKEKTPNEMALNCIPENTLDLRAYSPSVIDAMANGPAKPAKTEIKPH